jgi:formylmethanofuran dehydrogenase subunit C
MAESSGRIIFTCGKSSAAPVSERVVLTLRAALEHPLDASCIAADRLAALSEREISALPMRYDGRGAALGDFFTVRADRAVRVRIVGSLDRADGIGTGMAGGELVIDGNVGRDLGLGMSGGTIDVHGNAGVNAGGASPGAARGITGGEIVIRGSVAENVGNGMRRGIVVVMGDAGRGTGQGVIAGTVVVFGTIAAGAGRFLKRGTIVGFGEIERPATFRYACTFRPPHLQVLFRYLRRHYELPIAEMHLTGRYHRYSGDFAELGRGEILQWAGA